MSKVITQVSNIASWTPSQGGFLLNPINDANLLKVQPIPPFVVELCACVISLAASEELILAHEASSLNIVLLKSDGKVAKTWKNKTYAGSAMVALNKFFFLARDSMGTKAWYSIDTESLELQVVSSDLNQMAYFFNSYGVHHMEKEKIVFFENSNFNITVSELQRNKICSPAMSNFFDLKYKYLENKLVLIQYKQESVSLYSLKGDCVLWVEIDSVFLSYCSNSREYYLLNKERSEIITLSSSGKVKSRSRLTRGGVFVDDSIVVFMQKALISTTDGKILALDITQEEACVIKSVTIEKPTLKVYPYLLKITKTGFLGVHTGGWAGAQIIFYDFEDFITA